MVRGFLVAIIGFLFGSTAVAQSPGQTASQSAAPIGWHYHGEIYLWGPTVGGKLTIPPPSDGTGAGVDIKKILRALDFAFMGNIEARKDRYGVIADVIYVNFSADKSGTRDLILTGPGGNIVLPTDVSAKVGLGVTGFAMTVAGGYLLHDTERHEVQGIAGLRYLDMDVPLDWQLSGNIGTLPSHTVSGRFRPSPQSWNGVVGVRGRSQVGDSGTWYVPYYLDIGTGDAKLTYQAALGVGYNYDWGNVSFLYRHLNYDFKRNPAVLRLTFSGPALSVGFRW